MQELKVDELQHLELSLTKSPANGEEFIMTKSADDTTQDESTQNDENTNDDSGATTPPATPAYSFENTSEEVQQAAAALGEQLLSQQESLNLSGEVLEFAKSAAALKKETDPVTLAKSVLGTDTIAAITGPLEMQVVELQKTVQSMQDEKIHSEMTAIAREIAPEADEATISRDTDRLVKLSKAFSAEEFAEYVREAKATSVQLRKSALFERTASGRSAVTGSAEEQIEQLKLELIKSDKTSDEALSQIAREHPDLWGQYMNEVRYRSANGAATGR